MEGARPTPDHVGGCAVWKEGRELCIPEPERSEVVQSGAKDSLKLCGLELEKAGGCFVWKQRKLEATPGIDSRIKSVTRQGWGQQKSRVEEVAR